jgi:hypothetical protein
MVEWGRLKVVRRDIKKGFSPPFHQVGIKFDYINFFIKILYLLINTTSAFTIPPSGFYQEFRRPVL